MVLSSYPASLWHVEYMPSSLRCRSHVLLAVSDFVRLRSFVPFRPLVLEVIPCARLLACSGLLVFTPSGPSGRLKSASMLRYGSPQGSSRTQALSRHVLCTVWLAIEPLRG